LRLSSKGKLLAPTLIAYILADILLTPAGFETRPLNGITTLGYATLVLIFIGLAMIVISLILLPRNPHRSSMLAIAGLILYFPALVTDRTGYFAAQASPDAITVVEIIQAIIAIMGLIFAGRLYRERSIAPAAAPT